MALSDGLLKDGWIEKPAPFFFKKGGRPNNARKEVYYINEAENQQNGCFLQR